MFLRHSGCQVSSTNDFTAGPQVAELVVPANAPLAVAQHVDGRQIQPLPVDPGEVWRWRG